MPLRTQLPEPEADFIQLYETRVAQHHAAMMRDFSLLATAYPNRYTIHHNDAYGRTTPDHIAAKAAMNEWLDETKGGNANIEFLPS